MVAVVLLGIRAGWLPESWKRSEPWLGLVGAAAGGGTTFAGAVYDSRQGKRKTRREKVDHLVDGLKWNMFDRDHISPFDLGFAVWTPRPDRLRRRVLRRPARLTDSTYRARSRNRHATTGIEWTVGKGVIGRCIEIGDVIGVDLEDLWGALRGCNEPTWLTQPEVDVRQRLTYKEFIKAQGSGTVISGGHLNFVLAVPILAPSDGKVLGCVALDMPPGVVPGNLSEGHYIVEGLRGIADVLGSAES